MRGFMKRAMWYRTPEYSNRSITKETGSITDKRKRIVESAGRSVFEAATPSLLEKGCVFIEFAPPRN
jgi:hypothetical protein